MVETVIDQTFLGFNLKTAIMDELFQTEFQLNEKKIDNIIVKNKEFTNCYHFYYRNELYTHSDLKDKDYPQKTERVFLDSSLTKQFLDIIRKSPANSKDYNLINSYLATTINKSYIIWEGIQLLPKSLQPIITETIQAYTSDSTCNLPNYLTEDEITEHNEKYKAIIKMINTRMVKRLLLDK